jgi:hypothetical protein
MVLRFSGWTVNSAGTLQADGVRPAFPQFWTMKENSSIMRAVLNSIWIMMRKMRPMAAKNIGSFMKIIGECMAEA